MRAIDIDNLKPEPLYVVVGDDDELVMVAKSKVLALAAGIMSDFNIRTYTLAQTNYKDCVGDIRTALATVPFGAACQVVSVYSAAAKLPEDAIKGLKSLIDDFKAEYNDTAVLILINTSGAFTDFQKLGAVIDCNRLMPVELYPIVRQMVEERGYSITESAMQRLVLRCDRYLSNVKRELSKLYDYVDGAKIDVDAVDECLPEKSEYIVFEITDALSRGDKDYALKTINNIISTHSNRSSGAMLIISQLIAHYRRMFLSKISKDSNIVMASHLGCKEYAIKKAREAAARYTALELKKIVDKLQSIEVKFKSGLLTDSEIVLLAVCELFAK